MKEWLKQYLVFSKKERLGLVVLLALIGSIWLLPELFGTTGKIDKEILARADSFRVAIADSNSVPGDRGSIKIFSLFPFDPNTLDEEGWEKLGIRPKTIGVIKNYIAKGGRFRVASDLSRIYGLRPDESARLIPYVNIGRSAIANRQNNGYPVYYRHNAAGAGTAFPGRKEGLKFSAKYSRRKEMSPFDINTADTSMLIALPGIGSRLAARIVQFRDKLGGFYKIEQVAEIYGLQDSVYRLIRPFLLLNEVHLRMIPINSLGFDSLNAHPYIQFAEARAIVQYRKQHGAFKNISNLLNISILTQEWLEKVGPYLMIDSFPE